MILTSVKHSFQHIYFLNWILLSDRKHGLIGLTRHKIALLWLVLPYVLSLVFGFLQIEDYLRISTYLFANIIAYLISLHKNKVYSKPCHVTKEKPRRHDSQDRQQEGKQNIFSNPSFDIEAIPLRVNVAVLTPITWP